jgi:DNA-binding PucR family transcriptional regulator
LRRPRYAEPARALVLVEPLGQAERGVHVAEEPRTGELGELGADDDVARRLAATLRVYLDENASRSRAAKRLNIHDNTVSYRVRQAQELLGRRVDERSLELRVALALHSALPPA